MATVQSASTASGCATLLDAVGTGASGTAPSPTGKGTAGATGSTKGATSKAAAPIVHAPAFLEYSGVVYGAYALIAFGSLTGMLVL
jgi:hypothetical protein